MLTIMVWGGAASGRLLWAPLVGTHVALVGAHEGRPYKGAHVALVGAHEGRPYKGDARRSALSWLVSVSGGGTGAGGGGGPTTSKARGV